MMWNGKKISIVLPAYNEEENISQSIRDFFSTGVVDEVIVVDNNSTDNTSREVQKTKAKLVLEKNQGYGFALMRGLKEAKGDFIVTCEPDNTFVANDIFKLLAYTGDFDAVFGTRTSKESIRQGANMNLFLRLGNEFLAKLLEYVHNGPSLTDVGCTFKLVSRKALNKILPKFTVGKSHFSPEFMMLCIKNQIKTVEIPLNYKARIGKSKITGTWWKALRLGFVMMWIIIIYKFKHKNSA